MIQRQKITVRMDTCLGCHTCELECAIAHSGEEDIVAVVANGKQPGYRIYVESFGETPVPIPCNHCEEAACVMACPTGAVHRKTDDGPVFVEAERCIGCSMCVQACPFGVITVSPITKTAYKCDLCIERLAKGQEPACVASCPTKSLFLESDNDQNRGKRQKVAEMMVTAAAEGEKELEG